MQATKTMLLGLLIILVGMSILIFVSGSISVGVTGEFNGLVTAFVHQGQGESPVAYALRIVSFLQAVGNVALALIIGGLLAGIVGYIRKE